MPLTVAIVGRPNVGKSTLFNRLAGRRAAIVDDRPGVTRDRAFADSNLGGLMLRLVDTAGYEAAAPESLPARMAAQTAQAVKEADVCVLLIDAREGVTPGDEIVASALRLSGKPVIVAANKCESAAIAETGEAEAYRLGFGEPVAISAEHGLGLAELREALMPFAAEEAEEEIEPEGPRALRLAIVGRPNVGKSTLMNRLIGAERALTGPEAGLTRDAVAAQWRWQDRDIALYDTAGLRKKARIDDRLEKLSVESTLHAVRFADCVILAMDAREAFEKQDLAIADLIAREGRAVVFAANKWDLVEDRAPALKDLREKLDRLLPQVAGAAVAGVSALTGEGIALLMESVADADRIWNTRLTTAELNRFLKEALERHPPPAIKGRRVRIRYTTQVKARPPTFALFGNQLKALPASYLRYLTHQIREAFGLPGTPIRMTLRQTTNPYTE
jgi:GTPase